MSLKAVLLDFDFTLADSAVPVVACFWPPGLLEKERLRRHRLKCETAAPLLSMPLCTGGRLPPDGRPHHIEQAQSDMRQAKAQDTRAEFSEIPAVEDPDSEAGYRCSESGHRPTGRGRLHQSTSRGLPCPRRANLFPINRISAEVIRDRKRAKPAPRWPPAAGGGPAAQRAQGRGDRGFPLWGRNHYRPSESGRRDQAYGSPRPA